MKRGTNIINWPQEERSSIIRGPSGGTFPLKIKGVALISILIRKRKRNQSVTTETETITAAVGYGSTSIGKVIFPAPPLPDDC